MKNLQLFSLIIVLFSLMACSGTMERTRDSGKIALNEPEKNRILQHYSKPKDSLKRKAAKFLLEHISAHYSNESPIFKEIKKKYDGIKTGIEYVRAYETFSSVLESVHGHEFVRTEEIRDEQLVSGGFIIGHVEQAFEVWKNKSWSKEVDFETFCEYLLPYRVMDEPLGFDRRFFRQAYGAVIGKEKDIYVAFDSIVKRRPVGYYRSMDEEWPYLMAIDLSHKIGIGNCVQQAVTETMILRSAGIPATVDYVPHWGNYSGRHFAVKLIDKKRKTKSTFDLSLSEHRFTIPPDSLPEGISAIQYRKTIPKVYRMTWSVQPERLLLNSGNRTESTGLFRDLYEKDVTDEYAACSTVGFQVGDSIDNTVYLCVFDREGWMPVCASPVNSGEVTFEKIGREVVFLPVFFKETGFGADFVPVGPPFYFTADGEFVSLSGDVRKKRKAHLYSKFPLCSYTAFHAFRMKGGQFQGACSADFSDAETLFSIDYYPFYKQEIAIKCNKIFRYYRYLPPPGVVYALSELQFYSRKGNGEPERMPGIYFERYKSGVSDFNSLNDNDLDTYCRGVPVRDSWIGYDTGEANGCRLSKVVFAPQNDGNCIVPGYSYELCYWTKDGWTSLGEKRAAATCLQYENLPQKALFRLKCHTKGIEERIFTYENGRQVWW